MKASNIEQARSLLSELKYAEDLLELFSRDDFTITEIQFFPHIHIDSAMKAALIGTMRAEWQRRRMVIRQQLSALGVELDDEGGAA